MSGPYGFLNRSQWAANETPVLIVSVPTFFQGGATSTYYAPKSTNDVPIGRVPYDLSLIWRDPAGVHDLSQPYTFTWDPEMCVYKLLFPMAYQQGAWILHAQAKGGDSIFASMVLEWGSTVGRVLTNVSACAQELDASEPTSTAGVIRAIQNGNTDPDAIYNHLTDRIQTALDRIGTPPMGHTVSDDANSAAVAAGTAATQAANASGDAATLVTRLGNPGMGHTVADDLIATKTAVDAMATILQDLAALSGTANGAAGEEYQLGYVSATGLLTLKTITADKWDVAVTGSPTRVRITVGGTLFDSDTYSGDFNAFIAAIGAAPNINQCVGVEGGFYIQAEPGVALTTVTSLLVTGGSGTLTHSETGAITATAWVQFYADAACTTPHNGPRSTALGVKRLNAAP